MTDAKHPMQRGMQVRTNLLLTHIEEAGAQGIEQKELELLFFMNGFGTPALVRKYLTLLTEYDKIKKEGSRFFSRNYPERGDVQQVKIESYTHIHTHSEGQPS